MDFSPEKLRARFAALTERSDAIDAELAPDRDELAALVQGDTKLSVKAAQEREAEIRDRIVKGQAKLAPIEAERAVIARALGGKTSAPAEDETAPAA